MTAFRELRDNHDFTVLWVGQTVSELGTRVSMFVFPLVTYTVTGSALFAGIAGGLELLGTALTLLPGGLLGDALYAITGWLPFLFDAVTFAFSWVLLGRIRADLSAAPRTGAPRRARTDIAEGLRFTWGRPLFRTVMVWGMCSNLVVNA